MWVIYCIWEAIFTAKGSDHLFGWWLFQRVRLTFFFFFFIKNLNYICLLWIYVEEECAGGRRAAGQITLVKVGVPIGSTSEGSPHKWCMPELTDNRESTAGCCQIVRSLAESRCEWTPLNEECWQSVRCNRKTGLLRIMSNLIQYARNHWIFFF